MSEEHTHTGIAFENERTSLAQRYSEAPPALAPEPRAAFLVAHDRLSALAEAARGPALAVVAIDARARVVDASLVPDRSALVIGRHTYCGLRLPRARVALRQMAVLARQEDGKMHAHVWDLRTEQPFTIEDGGQVSAVVADGPLYLAVDEYAMWVVPVDLVKRLPGRASDAWDALPKRSLSDRRYPGEPPPMDERTGPARPAMTGSGAAPARTALDEITHVTTQPAPVLVGDDPGAGLGWGSLTLSSGNEQITYAVSADRLARGILVGRYERCGLRIGPLGRVSRVHVLVVRIGDEVWAIDAASSNGVRRGSKEVSAVVLGSPDQVVLADVLTVGWRKTLFPDA
ncbi:MAG: FHA domain-containing protein [Polyangiaceae bacterium]